MYFHNVWETFTNIERLLTNLKYSKYNYYPKYTSIINTHLKYRFQLIKMPASFYHVDERFSEYNTSWWFELK